MLLTKFYFVLFKLWTFECIIHIMNFSMAERPTSTKCFTGLNRSLTFCAENYGEPWEGHVWQVVSNKFLVSNETVVLCRWERSKQKFGFIKGVNKGWITIVKDLESWRFER